MCVYVGVGGGGVIVSFYRYKFFNPRRHKLNKVTRRNKGGGGGNNRSLPSTFDTSHLIDLIFGIYNELPLYFQLS